MAKKIEVWPYEVDAVNPVAQALLRRVEMDPAARTLPLTLPGPTVDENGDPLPENDPRRKPQRLENFVPIVVDGGVAAALLEHNTVNRQASRQNVEVLARTIYNNQWKFNGTSMMLPCSNTAIMDKQHTLMAVCEAFRIGEETGVAVQPILMIPIIGLHPDVFATIDSGKGRNAKDTLTAAEKISKIDMREINEHVHSHAIRLFAQYNNLTQDLDPSNPYYLEGLRSKLANNLVVDLFTMTTDLQMSLDFCQRIGVPQHSRALIPMAVLGLTHMIIANVQSPTAADRFIKSLAHGVDLNENSPIYRLREQLIRDKSAKRRMEGIEILAMCIRTWNYIARHQETPSKSRIRGFNNDGSFPEPLPIQRRANISR